MDPFTHTFVGLAAAKAGLDRQSPLATTVCILAANSPDSDIVVRFVAGPSDYLHHHRGITHSIIGVLALAIIVPSIVWLAEHGLARLRRTQPHALPRIAGRVADRHRHAPTDGLDEQLWRQAVSAVGRAVVLR